MPRYSADAVNNAIASSNRHGRKISGREAKLIHRLLAGRSPSGNTGTTPADRGIQAAIADDEARAK